MTFKNEQELRKYVKKRVERDVVGKAWLFNGVKFVNHASYFHHEFFTQADYVCDLTQLSVKVYRGDEFNSTYEEIAEKSFNGEDAISSCIEWVVDKLVAVYTLINERLAPYALSKRMYDIQLNRSLNLKQE